MSIVMISNAIQRCIEIIGHEHKICTHCLAPTTTCAGSLRLMSLENRANFPSSQIQLVHLKTWIEFFEKELHLVHHDIWSCRFKMMCDPERHYCILFHFISF